MSNEAPLSVERRIFPKRPATMKTPEPEIVSAVAVVSVDPEMLAALSLPPQEIMANDKPVINQV